MPNQLTLPSKTTIPIPLKPALREYIQSHLETHPDAFRWDINKWEVMRKDAVNNTVHVSIAEKIIVYQAQLVLILTKLPVDIGLSIPYSRIFLPNSAPLALSNLAYERANVIYNLAALYCQIATSEDRSNGDGIKRALTHFQNAAGALSYLISSALPALKASLPINSVIPSDLSEPVLNALERLMLAQAQECFWQRAVVDNVKNHLIARLSLKTSLLYRDAINAMESDSVTSAVFTREWKAHVRTKCHHFAAAALYRKSVDDSEANRYGEELARLDMAKAEAKKALDIARKSGVANAVLDDVKSLNDTLETSYKRAERDNDLIYHHVVPSSSSIPPIQDLKDVVASLVPLGLKDPQTVVKGEDAIFGELTGWGVRVAIDIYKERKNDWVRLEIVDRAKQLDSVVISTLQSLNLPASLDALDRPIGLPPSLLGKAEEVRLEDGIHRIPALLEDVQRLARRNSAGLDEALDILDQEATEDEALRISYSLDTWTHPASHEANKELTDQARRFREVLDRAMEKDRVLRSSWEEWAERIAVLCWDENEIERAVPTSTASSLNREGSRPTQGHARALRSHLESLDDLVQARSELVERVQRIAESDDVGPRFTREAAAVARWIEVRPEVFDQAIEEELTKYDRYRADIEDGELKQGEALDEIKQRNSLFLDARREEPSVKAREHALQSLDLAYHQYRSICKDLTEGIKFYNDFATVLSRLKESCKLWVLQRKRDVEQLAESLNLMSISSPPQDASTSLSSYSSTGKPAQESSAQTLPQTPVDKTASTTQARTADMPPLSDLWQTSAQTLSTQTSFHETTSTAQDRKPDMGSDPWQRDNTRELPTITDPDDFALDLPPPDSAAWETMTLPASAHRSLHPSRTQGAAF